MANLTPKTKRHALIFAVLSALLAYVLGSQQPVTQQPTSGNGNESIVLAHAQKQSAVWVTATGNVVRLLPDDNKGSRHQRFLLQLPNRLTLLVAHNIDLGQRIPLKLNQSIQLHGRYEWNQKGGVIHWTHHDPSGKHNGGWVDYNGQRYR